MLHAAKIALKHVANGTTESTAYIKLICRKVKVNPFTLGLIEE